MNDAVKELVCLFDVEQLDLDLFRGRQPDSARARVYGGQVAAQALIAATRTVGESFTAHSLHSYFLRGGDYAVPIVYDVERIREGRSFLTRRVVARQHGRAIYYQTVDFQRVEDGPDHHDVAPEVPGPEHGLDLGELLRGRSDPESAALAREWAAIEARYLGNSQIGLAEDPAYPSRARLWMRVADGLPADPVLHQAAFTYASDISLLGSSLAAHQATPEGVQMASLDHTIWFHRPFAVDQWWLYDQVSPSASGGRGLSLGRVFTEDGTLVATVAQEGLIRPRDDGFGGTVQA